MTNFYYEKTYSVEFANAVRALAEREPDLLERLEEGPRTIGQLEHQLRVGKEDRLELINKYAEDLAHPNPEVVLRAAENFTRDRQYLENKTKVYKACMAIRPPHYTPIR